MSSHADTIRAAISTSFVYPGTRAFNGTKRDEATSALDALLAENQKLQTDNEILRLNFETQAEEFYKLRDQNQRLREALHRHLLNDALQNQYHYEAAVEFADKGLVRALAAVVEE